jgi:predicted transcriptional regulator
MAPRAAARLESLGFGEVYEYKAGKSDWLAAGLPTEGTNAGRPHAGDVARKDVPVCGLKDRVGNVRERVRAAGWDAVVVVDDDRVVLGLLRAKELEKDGDLLIEQAMRPGPSTFRPNVLIHEMAHFMVEHNVESSLVTTSDGKLVGLLMRPDVMRVAAGER